MADLTGIPWHIFPLDAAPRDQVSENFRFYELTKSETADRAGIDNSFSDAAEMRFSVYTCRHVLQPIRNEFGSFTPGSVYRSQALERVIKNKPDSWVSGSQHARGQAADVEVPGLPTVRLARWVEGNLDFDQLILECYNPEKGLNSGWVHVSILPPGTGENRQQVLSYVFDPKVRKYIYTTGLHQSPV